MTTRSSKHSQTRAAHSVVLRRKCAKQAIHRQQHALARELVDHAQPLERPIVVVAIVDEVHAPHMVLALGPATADPVGRVAQPTLLVLLSRHPEAFTLPEPVHPLDIHTPAIEPEHPAHHPVAAARVPPHQLVQTTHQVLVAVARHGGVPLRRTRLIEHAAHPSLGLMEMLLHVLHDAPPSRGARCFPR